MERQYHSAPATARRRLSSITLVAAGLVTTSKAGSAAIGKASLTLAASVGVPAPAATQLGAILRQFGKQDNHDRAGSYVAQDCDAHTLSIGVYL